VYVKQFFISNETVFAVCFSPGRGRLHDISVEKWQIVDDTVKQNMARMASTAAWGLGLSLLCVCLDLSII